MLDREGDVVEMGALELCDRVWVDSITRDDQLESTSLEGT